MRDRGDHDGTIGVIRMGCIRQRQEGVLDLPVEVRVLGGERSGGKVLEDPELRRAR